ncbi:MAG: hypothetical protein ABFD75_12075 [Smithella sp.]
MRDLPKVIWDGTIGIYGITLRCYILENKQRLIDAEDVGVFLEVSTKTDLKPTQREIDQLAKFLFGGRP